MKRAIQAAIVLAAVLVMAGLAAPRFSAGAYRGRIQNALEKALARKVEIGEVHFNLFTGAGFSVSNVYIHEVPELGMEPIAYVETLVAMPRVWSLWSGSLAFSSLRLEGAQINLSRSRLPSGEYRWNFERLLRPSLVAAFPSLTIRAGRINFKAEELKSVVYLLDSDLDVEPPSSSKTPWRIRFEGKPARTDRGARGSGVFTARGAWSPETGKLDLDLVLDRSELSDIVGLIQGEDIGLHGFVSGKAHLAGPPQALRINGRLNLLDIHGFDQSVPQGETWPLDLSGEWNLPDQRLKIDAGIANKISVRYVVERYFTQPRWAVNLGFRDFSVEPLAGLARHMGLPLPEGMKLTGKLEGMIGYAGSLQGEAAFHDVGLALPGAQAISFDSAHVLITDGRARLLPARAVFANRDEAEMEAAFTLGSSGELHISTKEMDVHALAGVPLLSALSDGRFRGQLRLTGAGWEGNGQLTGATVKFPAFSEPVAIESADARIDGPRVSLQRIRAAVGGIATAGDYRYEPGAARPHRVNLSLSECDTAALEKIAMPALSHPSGLFGFGRAAPPEWLRQIRTDGSVRVSLLHAGAVDFQNVRTRVLWDGTRLSLPDLKAALGPGALQSRVLIDLGGRAPSYEAVSRLSGMPWKDGTLDADTVLLTNGLGQDALNHIRSTGTFAGHGVLDDYATVSGRYDLRWSTAAPHLNFTDLRLAGDGEILTGKASLQADGSLLVQLANGTRTLRVALQ